MRVSARSFGRRILAVMLALAGVTSAAPASEFSEPWLRSDRALVIDAYEYNVIDWEKLATDERITGFIGKGSDGLPPAYHCSGDETEEALCSALWKRYSVAKELFHTRKAVAKSLGLEWGAYHLGRPGNPIDQANHFLDFAQPGPDDLVALDIEENDPEKWMSLEDAEEFARHIKRRIGRYPVLYTNGSTAKHIAENRDEYPLLSRLPLWYARYKPEIGEHFPKGHWESYALWQFVSQTNCNERSCPYRPPGTNSDIDVNVASMSVEELREAWPFGDLVAPPEEPEQLMARVPVPTPRSVALGGGDVTLTYAPVKPPKSVEAFTKVFAGVGAEQDKLSAETPDKARKASADPAEAAPADLAKPAVYVRLSALKKKSALAAGVEPESEPVETAPLQRLPRRTAEPERKPLDSSSLHLGTAEYFAWRKEKGLPFGHAAGGDGGKGDRFVTGAKREEPARAADPHTDGPDPSTTGGVTLVEFRSAKEARLVAPRQDYPGGSGWFEQFKAYLGIF